MSAGVTALLLLGGALTWNLQLRPPLHVDATRLDGFPHVLAGWTGHDVPIQSDVEEMLDADYNLQRTYNHPIAGFFWLYVGYYGTERGGKPEHTPWVCYPSNGWQIVERSVVGGERGDGSRRNELIVEKDGERRLVHFWYQSYRRAGLLGGLDQTLENMRNRLLDGRADGSLVRLSAIVTSPEEESAVRVRLLSMGYEVAPRLSEYWPTESVGGDES